jgi:Na+-driven multidrug efflux pump
MIKIGVPMGFEHVAVCGAMIASTKIIAPLGTVAIAANSIAVTAESICYMPGYGIASAATTLVGQSIGAGKNKIAKSFANLSVALGCAVMTVMAVLMYFICPFIFYMLTPDVNVQALAAGVLRIELFAEPLFAASIVASGALRGAGDTFIPSILNLVSIWGVRLTLSILLVGRYGLYGVWFAMCIELCVRGILLLTRQFIRLGRQK